MFAESHAKMSEKPCGRLTAQPFWSTAIICRLSMNYHSGLLCGRPAGEERADFPLAQIVGMLPFIFRIEAGLGDLAELFLQRHLPQQIGHPFFNWLRRILVDILLTILVQVIPARFPGAGRAGPV